MSLKYLKPIGEKTVEKAEQGRVALKLSILVLACFEMKVKLGESRGLYCERLKRAEYEQ